MEAEKERRTYLTETVSTNSTNGKPQGKNEMLTYQDVHIKPKYSQIQSRSNVDISTNLTKNVKLEAPFIASPMDTVCEEEMVFEMWRLGGLGILHRFDSIEKQTERLNTAKTWVEDYLQENNLTYDDKPRNFTAAIGATGDYLERAESLINAGVEVLLIDIAHGHHSYMKSAISKLKAKWPEIEVIAGSIATGEAAYDLINWGADALRVGVGNGCFTSDMEVNTNRGEVPISEIQIGDSVQTHTGKWKSVIDTFEYEETEEIVVVNEEIECTCDHEFYVVHEKYVDVVNENNIHQYAEWIEAENLTDEYYMVEYD